MEHSLSSEILRRLSQAGVVWASVAESLPKNNINTMLKNDLEEKEGHYDKQVSNTYGSDSGKEEADNPALEGHFLTEHSCPCRCHRDSQLTFGLSLPFSCGKCSQQFCCKCLFLAHKDFHRGERKYSCLECGKSYYYKSDLVRHLPVHSSVKPHVCRVCGRSFSQVGHLITHRLVHTGEKPFACDVCHKPFNRKSNLQKHKMIHTGERPFECVECGSRFSRKGDLQRHSLLHTGERPYKCESCDKSFSQKPHLLSHQSVHTGERPYKCLACTRSFNRKNNLLKHQLSKCPQLSVKRTVTSGLFSTFGQLFTSKIGIPGSELLRDTETSSSDTLLQSTVDLSLLRDRLAHVPTRAATVISEEAENNNVLKAASQESSGTDDSDDSVPACEAVNEKGIKIEKE